MGNNIYKIWKIGLKEKKHHATLYVVHNWYSRGTIHFPNREQEIH
jgi:hypothetical protein